jgi:hypothetical protein
MGKQVVPKLEESLHSGSAEQKGGIAMALAWIGGDEAGAAITHAIEIETDGEAKRQLKEALNEMRRYWEISPNAHRKQRLTTRSSGGRAAQFSSTSERRSRPR